MVRFDLPEVGDQNFVWYFGCRDREAAQDLEAKFENLTSGTRTVTSQMAKFSPFRFALHIVLPEVEHSGRKLPDRQGALVIPPLCLFLLLTKTSGYHSF